VWATSEFQSEDNRLGCLGRQLSRLSILEQGTSGTLVCRDKRDAHLPSECAQRDSGDGPPSGRSFILSIQRREGTPSPTTNERGSERANAQPAYAEGFGVAGAHSSRRSEAKAERPTPNIQRRIKERAAEFWRRPAPRPFFVSFCPPAPQPRWLCFELRVHLRYPIREIRVISGCFQKTGY
jgi:hypothetical protein